MSKKIKSSLPQKSILATALLVALGSQASYAADFIVTTNADSGAGSLREAISTSNGNGENDTISFDASLSGGTITLSSATGAIDIQGGASLTIQGLGQDLLTITNDTNTASVFDIDAMDSVTISDLTIDVHRDTESSSFTDGDIIDVTETSSLSLSNVTLNNSQGSTTIEEIVRGVDSYNTDNLSLSNVTISNMNSTVNGAAINSSSYDTNDTTITISNSTITGNNASRSGGGIRVYSYNTNVTLSVSNSTISSNSSREGGALEVYARQSQLDVSISNTTFDSNTVAGGKGGSDGGAVSVTTDYLSGTENKIVIASSTFSNNTAENHGGAISFMGEGGNTTTDVVIANSTFSGNTAGALGGAISVYIEEAEDVNSPPLWDVIIASSTITKNTSTNGDSGGLNVYNDTDEYGATNLSIMNTIIAGNGSNNVNAGDGTTLVSVTANYFGSSANFTVPANNLSGDTPDLGTLGDNGGLTQTHVPNDGSPLIDAGDNSLLTVDGTTLTVDQRSIQRVSGDTVDIGAVEVGGTLVLGDSTTTVTSGSSSSAFGFAWLSGAGLLLTLLRRRRK
jgi:predicted outer membrane repeat protein